MTESDVDDVIQLIRRQNNDDAEAATQTYQRSLEGQFVLKNANTVMGVTGAKPVLDTDRTYWLSWTYLSPLVSPSLDRGRVLFDLILEVLAEQNARKLFAAISPDIDTPFGKGYSQGGIEGSYLDFGFENEVTHLDYYLPGESMSVMSYRLQPSNHTTIHVEINGLEITDADELEETDDSYYLEWQFTESPDQQSNWRSIGQHVEPWLEKIRGWEGRMVFIGIPSNAESALESVKSTGFYEEGRLKDFLADGIDEVRLRFDL